MDLFTLAAVRVKLRRMKPKKRLRWLADMAAELGPDSVLPFRGLDAVKELHGAREVLKTMMPGAA